MHTLKYTKGYIPTCFSLSADRHGTCTISETKDGIRECSTHEALLYVFSWAKAHQSSLKSEAKCLVKNAEVYDPDMHAINN